MLSAWRTTFTRSSRLFWLAAGAAAGALAGAAAVAGFAPGIVAGFTAGAGAPGAGLVACATSTALLLVVVCGSDFAALPVLSMAPGFCPQAAPVIMTTARMPVVSFISDSYLPPAVAVAGLLPGPGPAGFKS